MPVISSKKKTNKTSVKKIGSALDAVEKDARNLQKRVIKRIDEQKIKIQANKLLII